MVAQQQDDDQSKQIFRRPHDQAHLERRTASLAQFLEIDVAALPHQADAENPLHPLADHFDRRRRGRATRDGRIAEYPQAGQETNFLATGYLTWQRMRLKSLRQCWGPQPRGSLPPALSRENSLAPDQDKAVRDAAA